MIKSNDQIIKNMYIVITNIASRNIAKKEEKKGNEREMVLNNYLSLFFRIEKTYNFLKMPNNCKDLAITKIQSFLQKKYISFKLSNCKNFINFFL